MRTCELMDQLSALGVLVSVCNGELAVDFEGELPSELEAELEAHAADVADFIQSTQGRTEAEWSPAGYDSRTRDVLTFPVTLPTGEPVRPTRALETTIADLHGLGIVALTEAGKLTIDAPRGTMDDRRREMIAAQADDIAAGIQWLELLDRRQSYKRALSLWLGKHGEALDALPSIRLTSGQTVTVRAYAAGLLATDPTPWGKVTALVDRLEETAGKGGTL